MKMYFIIAVIIVLLVVGGCALKGQVLDGDGMERCYSQISHDEAKKMMEADDGHIIVDVRRQDEYDEGHIPGAICIPNESIIDTKPAELPDVDQIILIYCRSGRRSKEAAQKLFDMGYTHIYEFGGILDWTGEVEVSEPPEYDMTPVAIYGIKINDKYFSPIYESNSSADAFKEKINSTPLNVTMEDYGGFEKVGDLPFDLPTNDEQITTMPGDIILYQGNRITIYYDENTYNLTKIGRIDATKEELLEAFGDGRVTVEFFAEWTE